MHITINQAAYDRVNDVRVETTSSIMISYSCRDRNTLKKRYWYRPYKLNCSKKGASAMNFCDRAVRLISNLSVIYLSYLTFFIVILSITPSLITAQDRTTPVPTATPIADAVQEAIDRAHTLMMTNADWQDVYPDGFTQFIEGSWMVLVPAGCFTLGNDPALDIGVGGDDGGEHCFDTPYWIDQYEVTQAQYHAFIDSEVDGLNLLQYGTLPQVEITIGDAVAYCEERGGQLPNEVEWEYAARGVDGWWFPWGNASEDNYAVWQTEAAMAVGSLPAGVSWVGAYDLAGNVWEMTRSQYADYPYNADDGRETWIEDDVFLPYVIRGGSWSYFRDTDIRSAYRGAIEATYLADGVGFRCIRALDTIEP